MICECKWCVVSAQVVTHIVDMPALSHGLGRTPPATARPGAKSPRSALAATSPAKSPRSALAATSSAKSPRFALRGGAKRNSSNNVEGRAGKNIGGKKTNKNTTKKKRTNCGKHKPNSRFQVSRLVYERRMLSLEDDRSRLCNEISRGLLLVDTMKDKARQQRQDFDAAAAKSRNELLEYQAAMLHKHEEQMQMEIVKIVQSRFASGEVPKFIECTRLRQGKLGAASSDLQHASHAVDAVVRRASSLLGMGAADRHMLMGAALRIVETCLADGSELPEHALAAARLTYRSSSASTWALAVFQTALALGGHGAVGNASDVVRTIAPDDSVRKSAWHIQCRLVNIFFGSSMCSAI